MATQYPLDLNKIKEMLNRPDSVKDLNNKEMNNIIQKQHELTMLVEKLRTSIRTDFSDMKQILNDNSKKYNNNSYLMNLKFKQHANFSEEVTKINKKITELTQEIYNDIIKLRSNEYKYQTLSKKEKMNLDKMVIDYKKKICRNKKVR